MYIQVPAWIFLSHLVIRRRIYANSSQIKALVDIPSPRIKKEFMRLYGRVAVLSQSISRSSDRCYKFFKILKGCKNFQWTEDCESAFQEHKAHLRLPHLLIKSNPGDVLHLYLAASNKAVRLVLTKKQKVRNNIQSIMLAKF